MNEDGLAALELQGRLDGADRGEPGERQSGGIDVRQPGGLLGDDRGLDRKLFSVGALAAGFEDAEHRIADFQIIDAHVYRGDQAGKIPAEHQGKRGLRILAAAHFPIGAVDTRRYYIDDNLVRCRHGIRQVAVFQDFRTTELFNKSRFHDLSPLYAQRASFETTRSVPRLGIVIYGVKSHPSPTPFASKAPAGVLNAGRGSSSK